MFSSLSLALPLVTFFSISGILSTVHAQNVTVNSNDTSQITFGGGAGDASICKLDADGKVIGGQAGCYNAPSMCTASAAMGQSADSFASWKFKGSALYITALLTSFSPEFTVTIDGNSTDADGARPGTLPFDCFSLFSTTGLDPSIEHTVNLTIKGPSPNRNMSFGPSTVFSLINYTYTTGKDTNTTTATSTGSGSNPSVSTTEDNSAALERAHVHGILSAFAITLIALLTMF